MAAEILKNDVFNLFSCRVSPLRTGKEEKGKGFQFQG